MEKEIVILPCEMNGNGMSGNGISGNGMSGNGIGYTDGSILTEAEFEELTKDFV